MPITITNPVTGLFGPGATVLASTDLIGPIPIDFFWRISLTTAVTEQVQFRTDIQTFGSRTLSTIWLNPQNQILASHQQVIKDGDSARLLVELISAQQIVQESASVAVTYETTTGLPVIQQELQVPGSGGLTEEQALQLETTAQATAVDQLLDFLTLTEATSGPTGAPLVVPLGTATFGVIVRLATIPDDLVPSTPDGQYWVKTLAVVRVFRANDLWFRVPIHTPTKIVPFAHEGLTVWVTQAELNNWILNIRVLVDFLPGVTGQVYLMHTP